MRHILILLGVLRLLSIRLQKVTTIKWAFFIHIFFFHKFDICYVQSPQASCSCKKNNNNNNNKNKKKKQYELFCN